MWGAYMSILKIFLFFLIFDILLRYPYIVIPIILLIVFRDRIPNPSEFFRRGRRRRSLVHAVEVNPHDFTSRRDLGMILLDTRKPAEALEVLSPAHEKDGSSAEVNHLMGQAFLRSGKPAEAVGYLKKSIEVDPRFRYGESHLYLSEAQLALKDMDGALNSIETYLGINQTGIEGLYQYARVLDALGEKDKAKEVVQRAIKTHKSNPRFRRNRDWRWYVRLKTLKRSL